MSQRRSALLLFLVVTFMATTAGLFYPPRQHLGPEFLAIIPLLYVLSTAIYLAASGLHFEGRSRALFQRVLFMALLTRALLWIGSGDTFPLSSDIYRYLWDGKMTAHGINPFLYPPSAPALGYLRDELVAPRINHPGLRTIYPPMAQNLFLLSYLAGHGTIWGFKAMTVFFELLTVATLLLWFRLSEIPCRNLLLWLFSPLVLVEFYFSSHVDILALPFCVAGLCCVRLNQPGRCGVLMAAAGLIKFLGLLFVPFLLLHWRGRHRLWFALAFLVTWGGAYLPYVLGSQGWFLGSLPLYLSSWEFNASVYWLFKQWLGAEHARTLVSVFLLGWLCLLGSRPLDIYTRLMGALGGYLVLTPSLMPWYVVWIYPMLLRAPSAAFLWLCAAVMFSYHGHYFIRLPGWPQKDGLALAEYLPFYALLAWEWLPWRRASKQAAGMERLGEG